MEYNPQRKGCVALVKALTNEPIAHSDTLHQVEGKHRRNAGPQCSIRTPLCRHISDPMGTVTFTAFPSPVGTWAPRSMNHPRIK